MTKAYEAMRWFLFDFWERGGREPVDAELLLVWTGRGRWENGDANDPAQWGDWLQAIEKVHAGHRVP